VVIKFLKRCRLPLAILIITAAVVSSLFRALTPWATQYKTDIEQHLSTLLGEPVHIQTMETGWYWFDPVIKLKEVTIGESQHSLQLRKLLVGINIVGSVWHWQIQPGVLYIDDLHLTLRQNDQGWQIDGLRQGSAAFDEASIKPVIGWIMAQQKIIIKHLSSDIVLQNGTVIPLRKLDLIIGQHSGHYRIKANAKLAKPISTSVELLADMQLDFNDFKNAHGQAYIAVRRAQFAQWQSLLSLPRVEHFSGKGSIQLWFDWQGGKVDNVQSRISGKHLKWHDSVSGQDQEVQSLKANIAWLANAKGWQLLADHLILRLNGIRWPENNLLVKYDKPSDTYQTFIKHIILSSLTSSITGWFKGSDAMDEIHPVGNLLDTQFHVVAGKMDYLLTRFTHLGWRAVGNWPSVANLSGVMHWQPEEGRIEFDSNQTLISPLAKPAIRLQTFNAGFDWKTLSHGLHVSMDRLVIQHPDLLLSATGSADDVSRKSSGQMDLNVALSSEHAERWLQYIPENKLKVKLENWLKNDIEQINSLTAEINIHGNYEDFPFDNTPGEFQIKSHFQGVDVTLAPDWPVTRDVEAYLSVDKRNMNMDVVHALLGSILIDKANLRIDDVGHDKESLLIHTKVDTTAQQALTYVMTTPLKKRLSALNRLKMQGLISLDLKAEAPLYPENDDVLVLGDMTFSNNQVEVNHSLTDVTLEDLNGNLQFDQDGILDSNMKATLMQYPVSLLMQSIRKPIPYVQVKIKGKTTVDVLKTKFNWPIFAFMQGDLWLSSTLMLTDDPADLDHLQIKSSLKGLAINLPTPLGKPRDIAAPLTVDLDFNPDKALVFRFEYADRLQGNLSFNGNKDNFELQNGEIHLGKGKTQTTSNGLQVTGVLPDFNLPEWQQVLKKIPTSENSQFSNALQGIDLLIQKTTIAGQNFSNLQLKAHKNPERDWTIQLQQPMIDANLRYDSQLNRLTGTFNKLHLQTEHSKTVSAITPSSYKPEDFPNMELAINNLQINQLSLGTINLQTTATKNTWRIDNLTLHAPSYSLRAKGQWQQVGDTNATTVQAAMTITDLAKSLEQWKITPVVEAKKGEIEFQGGWPGGFQDFDLSRVNGQMSLKFRNGRITHLSKETEEKLGLGKLLSILSLQTIPRRLTLDFSDLSKDGYSFDIFQGNFKVSQGMMSTLDSYIDGPIAYASMKGNLDISRQSYNLDLRVAPHITASLPIVATIAGGPIAGIATWVASKIINQGMQKVSGYTYKISGPWQQPVVQQVSIIRPTKDNYTPRN